MMGKHDQDIGQRSVADITTRAHATRFADGWPRRMWSVADVHGMLECGILQHGERFELVGGELVAMPPKGPLHEDLKTALNSYWIRSAPDAIHIAQETSFRLGDNDEPEPEFIVYPAGIRRRDVRGDTVLLVVEIADSSLLHDQNIKGPRYAAAGVREYWVIAARSLTTTVYTDPGSDGFASRREVPSSDLLTPTLAPSLALRLDGLDLETI
jgi:Uma2 family endonuclease